jgi:hypoxanthine-DNA glycosylase
MSRVRSFPPAAGPGAKALILGSMPGAASLAAGQYYAHPRNLFWPIMTELLGASGPLPYEARLRLLRRAGIALWDVLESCVRPGSSDSDIERATMRPNAVASFLRARPSIKYVFFNGSKAEECFRRYVLPSLPPGSGIKYARLPSTSPAHAALSRRRKLAAWKTALEAAGVRLAA